MEYLNIIRHDNCTGKIHSKGGNDPGALFWLNLIFLKVFCTLFQLCQAMPLDLKCNV